MSTTTKKNETAGTLFTKKNHVLIIAGGVLMLLGFLAMSGGKAPDVNTFNESDVYSFMRITLAPILILLGLGVLIFAILKNDTTTANKA